MSKVVASGTMERAFCILLSAVLAIILVLSNIPMARAADTGTPQAKEEMKTEQTTPPEAEMAKQAPAGETKAGMSESGKSGDPDAKDASSGPAKSKEAEGSK